MADRPRPASQGAKRTPRATSHRSLSATKPTNRPASVPANKPLEMDLLAKEEKYKKLNAELEAKTAELVRQAAEVMREQNEVLSKPIASSLNFDITDDAEEFGNFLMPAAKQSTAKSKAEKKALKSGRSNGPQSARRNTAQIRNPPVVDDVAVPEDFTDFSLAQTIRNIESKVNDGLADEQPDDDVLPSAGEDMPAEAQIRFLKARLRVMQEELNSLAHECNKKDDENGVLSSKLKEVEEDRVRLRRTSSTQQTQLEKQRALTEDANGNIERLRHQVGALQKELDGLKRAQKQASSSHNVTEVRLNRAREEAEKSKAELNKLKQSSKDSANQEQQRIDALQAENKMLKKQKAELVTGFKKQLKLIDILKKQKMHYEAARMMSFTEEEFMKALDWGKL